MIESTKEYEIISKDDLSVQELIDELSSIPNKLCKVKCRKGHIIIGDKFIITNEKEVPTIDYVNLFNKLP